jgi:hypothetical protein
MGITTFSGPVKTGPITATGNAVLGSGIKNTHPLGNVATQRHMFPTAPAAAGIALAQTYTSVRPADGRFHLNLNGLQSVAGEWAPYKVSPVTASTGVAANNTALQHWGRRVILTGAVATSAGTTFDITGTDATGRALTETGIVGPGIGVVVSTSLFATITDISAAANPNATATVSVGTRAATTDIYARPLGVVPYQSALTRMQFMINTNGNSVGGTTVGDFFAIGTMGDAGTGVLGAAGGMYAGSTLAAAGGVSPILGTGMVAGAASWDSPILLSTVQKTNWRFVQQIAAAGVAGANFNQTDAGLVLFYGSIFTGGGAATSTAGDWTTVVNYSQFANNGQTGANEALPFSPWNSN